MIVEFYHNLKRGDDELDVLVEYKADRYFDDVDIELISVTLDGVEIETSASEEQEIIEACFERLDDDYADEQAAYGDYVYDSDR